MAIYKIVSQKTQVTSYRARVCLINGKRVSRCFPRRANAEAWEANIRATFSSNSKRVRIKFGDLVQKYLDNHAKPMMAESSYQRYSSILTHFLAPTFNHRWIDEITKMDVLDFRASVEKLEMAPNSKNFIVTALKGVLKKAVEWDLLDRNPAEGVKPPRKGLPRIIYLTESEVRQFLNVNRDNPHLPVFITALNTGMRLGEILGLKWGAVDLENGFLSIREIYDSKLNAVKPSNKTHRLRQIGINQNLHALLVSLLSKRTSEYVFEHPGYRRKGYHFARIVRAACRKAGVKEVTFHDLRHTYGTAFVLRDGGIHALAGVLGHTTTAMTARYAHFGPEHARRAATIVSFDVPEDASVIKFVPNLRRKTNESGQKLASESLH